MVVIKMKKNLPVILAVVVGIGCAFILFKDVKKDDIEEFQSNAKAIQIGAFIEEDKAQKMVLRLGGDIVEDGDIYRIYYGVLSNDENINFMTTYLKENGIYYYIKDLMLTDEKLESIQEYEKLMLKSKNEEKLEINKKLLERYKEVM